MPNLRGLDNEGLVYAEPGRTALLSAQGDNTLGFLCVTRDRPNTAGGLTSAQAQAIIKQSFTSNNWDVAWLLDQMIASEDMFFDTVSQIRMASWSTRRVVLVGDAAYAP